MRWVTVLTEHGPRACGVWQGEYVDVNAADPEAPSSVRGLLELGPAGQQRAWDALARGPKRYDPARATLLAPIPDPRKIICLGLNYRDHAAESGMAIPTEPILFSKYATALIGHRGRDRPARSQRAGRLRGRAGDRHRPGGPAHPPRAGHGARGRLHRRPRRLGTRLAAEQAGQAVDGRQDLRHLRPGRPGAGHAPTRSPTPTPWASGCASTARRCRTRARAS